MDRPLSVEWLSRGPDALVPGHVRILDQTRLPLEVAYLDTTDVAQIWTAIKTLQVRGAPAIGVAAAMGLAAAAQGCGETRADAVVAAVEKAAEYLATSRPTAVNLFWALDRVKKVARAHSELPARALTEMIVREAVSIRDEDAAMCRAIGEHGSSLLEDGQSILTHCNAGSLATSEWGTALSPVYVAAEQGKHIRVFVDETRPLLQGARLSAWELMQAGIDVTLICDNMAAQVMKEGRIDAVMVGADRIAANGDAANKIGTYGVAVLAKHHGIPFYVLAPTSTIDMSTPTGEGIPIEERGEEEVTEGFGKRTAPRGVAVYSPAFDVTPAELIAGIVCESGIVRPPCGPALAELFRAIGAGPTAAP